MTIRRRDGPESRGYYGLVEEVIEADEGSPYSRSHLLIDCIESKAFEENDLAPRDKSSLALVRTISTPRKWEEEFGLTRSPAGNWVAFEVDDAGDAPLAWVLPASENYLPRTPRSVRSMRLLGDGVPDIARPQDAKLAQRLIYNASWGKGDRPTQNLADLGDALLGGLDDDIEFIALDVGQASAVLIKRGGQPIGLFDVRAPIWFNKGSLATGFVPPVVHNGFVFLSHWDFDHFDLGRRHGPYRDLRWYAPEQAVGLNTALFQAELGTNLTFVDGALSISGFTFARGTATNPKDRNGSGYQLRYQRKNDVVLLTGDAGYLSISAGMLAGTSRLTIPHHAGRGTTPPAPHGLAPLAIASFGYPNSYKHPNQATLAAHLEIGWSVDSTAAFGNIQRGNRRIYP